MLPNLIHTATPFPFLTAFYPGSGSDVSYLKPLLEKGVRIFIHCDVATNQFPSLTDAVLRKLTENNMAPTLLSEGDESLEEHILSDSFHRPYFPDNRVTEPEDIRYLHSLFKNSGTLNLNGEWQIVGKWKIIQCNNPDNHQSFILCFINAEASILLQSLWITQNPDYIILGKIENNWSLDEKNRYWTILQFNAHIHAAYMPVIIPPTNREAKPWEGYTHETHTNRWIPESRKIDFTTETLQGDQFPHPDYADFVAHLKEIIIGALHPNPDSKKNNWHTMLPLPGLSPEKVNVFEDAFTNNRTVYEQVSDENYENRKKGIPIKQNVIRSKAKIRKHLLTQSIQDIPNNVLSHTDLNTGCSQKETGGYKGLKTGCERFYDSEFNIIGEDYYNMGHLEETRIVLPNPIILNPLIHPAATALLNNLEMQLIRLMDMLQTIPDSTNLLQTIHELLHVRDSLCIQVYPLIKRYKQELPTHKNGWSAAIRFSRNNQSRIAEAFYIKGKVRGCIRFYDNKNQLSGEAYIWGGQISEFSVFENPVIAA